MMNSFIMIFSVFANLIAVLLIYNSFGRKEEKQKRLINTLIAMGAIYIVVLVVYFFSSLGIEKTLASDQTKTMLTLAFVPVNAILFIPFLVMSQRKVKERKLSRMVFSRRLAITIVLAVIVLISEFFYFRNFQKSMVKLQQEINEKKSVQENVVDSGSFNVINEIEDNKSTNKIMNQINNNTYSD